MNSRTATLKESVLERKINLHVFVTLVIQASDVNLVFSIQSLPLLAGSSVNSRTAATTVSASAPNSYPHACATSASSVYVVKLSLCVSHLFNVPAMDFVLEPQRISSAHAISDGRVPIVNISLVKTKTLFWGVFSFGNGWSFIL